MARLIGIILINTWKTKAIQFLMAIVLQMKVNYQKLRVCLCIQSRITLLNIATPVTTMTSRYPNVEAFKSRENRHVWSTIPPARSRIPRRYIVIVCRLAQGNAHNIVTKKEPQDVPLRFFLAKWIKLVFTL